METPRQPQRPRRRRSKAPTRCARCLAYPQDRKYVTMWNTTTRRKIAGTAAPCQDELPEYLGRHPHVQVYTDQDGGPDAIKQRRKDRNREKEQRKRERKKLSTNGEPGNLDTGIDRGEVDCLDKGSTVTGQIGQPEEDRLDSVGAWVQEESRVPRIKEDVCGTPSVGPEKLIVVKKENLEEKEKESSEEDKDVTYTEDVFRIGPFGESEQPSALFASLLKKEEERKKGQKESGPATEDQIECQIATEFRSFINQDREPRIQPETMCLNERGATQRNKRGSKRKMTFSGSPDQWDISFVQRVWTAEAYAMIAERERKRKKDADMKEEDEEIREFREIIRRIS